jgi:hypothetical protein
VRNNDVQWIELRPESAPKTDRLIQFGLQVEDAEAMRAYLASRGVAVPSSTSLGAIGNLGFHVKDPDGHMVEFWRGSSNDRTLSWIHLKLPEDRNYVEFMERGTFDGSIIPSVTVPPPR